MDGDDFYREETSGPTGREERVDPYLQRAKAEIGGLFREDTSLVAYGRQLAVRLERKYFHWITARAVDDLVGEGAIRREQHPLRTGASVSFIFHRSLRYRRRAIRRKLKILNEYAEASVRFRVGEWAELLFLAGFSQHGFVCAAREARAYRGKQWTDTDHDLDFVLEGPGGP